MTVAFATTTIVVSGYHPICGTTAYVDSLMLFRMMGTEVDARSALHLVPTGVRVIPPRPLLHCQKCLRYVPWSEQGDARLGFTAYCQRCVEGLGLRCVRLNHRLPGPNEFYCARCDGICPVSELCPPEKSTGKRRFRCMRCRREQWRTRSAS